MPRYAILDTETSGLFDFSRPADADGQPRLAAMALILTDEDLKPTDEYYVLIQPDGWEISPEITAINGLTTERCATEGVPVADALAAYADAVNAGYVVVAYNAQFDTKMMRGEFRRAGMDDLFERTPNICAMRACKPLGVEKAGAKKSGFPKLADAYRHFYKSEPAEQHRALADARTCLAIFQKLIYIGAAPEPAVHYAKNRSEGATS